MMLQAGAEVNVATDQQWTSLHLAAKEQNTHVMGVLLANQADGALKDCYGATPLHYAVQLADANHFNTLHSSPRCVVKTPDSRGTLVVPMYHVYRLSDLLAAVCYQEQRTRHQHSLRQALEERVFCSSLLMAIRLGTGLMHPTLMLQCA